MSSGMNVYPHGAEDTHWNREGYLLALNNALGVPVGRRAGGHGLTVAQQFQADMAGARPAMATRERTQLPSYQAFRVMSDAIAADTERVDGVLSSLNTTN